VANIDRCYVDTNDKCKIIMTVRDPNPASAKSDNKIEMNVVDTGGITCEKNANKVVEIIEQMHIKNDLKELDKLAPEIMTMDEKSRLMKHTNNFMNQLYSSVVKGLNHSWEAMGLEVPKNKDAQIARIMAKVIAQVSKGNPNISKAILKNIESD
jgi:hypothetical protein